MRKKKNCIWGCRHGSVDLSVPSILPPRVRVQSTPSTLFSIYIVQIVFCHWIWIGMWKERKLTKRGRDWPIFKWNTAFWIRKTVSLSWVVWRDVGVKISPNISKSWPKSSQSSFYTIVRFLPITQKVANYLGFFCWQNWLQRIFTNRPICHVLGTHHKFGFMTWTDLFLATARYDKRLIVQNSI